MTKLEFKSGKTEGNAQHPEQGDRDSSASSNDTTGKQEPEKRLKDVLAALGLDSGRDDAELHVGFSCIGMDWAFLLRVANAQAILSIYGAIIQIKLSIACLTSSMLLTKFNFYRFTSSAWATYLLSCAYIGMRAGRWQSYPHAIAYCGMCTFQSLVYMSTMCWLFYSVYALNAHTHTYDFSENRANFLFRFVLAFSIKPEIHITTKSC
ncbi:unnamed protein product, partial [Gongylonema pulchrum]|uniref:Vesicle transport protein n=1 Tax=Gongylonema pulchrum TaxID=637853 RepID=A0A183CYU4_9BILA